MSTTATTRRGFLAAGSAAVLGSQLSTLKAAAGANERLSIGMIGVGGRGTSLMNNAIALKDQHNVEVTAVCDVWKPNLNRAADAVEKAFGKKPRTFSRFGDLLALDDVDIVMIAPPDFAHTPIMIEALRAGKDVYVEKPMAMDVDNATTALNLAREKKRIVQVGTQRRSEGKFKAVAKAIADGVLGDVTRISAGVYFNNARWARDYSDCKASDVDWDAYLFNSPKRPFDPKLLRRWHLYYLCTNGLSGLWMSHFADAVNILMGSTYPSSAIAHGATYHYDDRETEDTFQAVMDYPEKFMFTWGMGIANGSGAHFTVHGRDATLDVDRMVLRSCGSPKDKEIEGKKMEMTLPDVDHVGNWLECVRSRELPNADIAYGHQHAVTTIMAAAAMQTGRRHVYDQKTQRIHAV